LTSRFPGNSARASTKAAGVPTTRMIAMVTAVVRALKSNASNATGDAIARQAPSFTVQITRLNNGRLMNPASKAKALTARPEASLSPPPS
jgi:hypothetical protein